MSSRILSPDDPLAPAAADARLGALSYLGNPAILERIGQDHSSLALLSSAKAPAGVLLAVHDLAREWRQSGPIIISGFHSPVENEALSVLLAGPQPVVLVLARGLYRRPPDELRPALDAGRLLILSPFAESVHRATADTAARRNRTIAVLARAVLFAHAQPSSKTEALATEALAWAKPVYTLDHPANANLLEMGAFVYPGNRHLPAQHSPLPGGRPNGEP